MLGTQYNYADNLESPRLVTRWLKPVDSILWASFFDTKTNTLFLPDFGFKTNLEKAQHMINFQLKRYEEKRYGLQAIVNKATGDFIGLCGLLLQEVEGIKELEIGYHLLTAHQGKGYATEAAKVFRNYAQQQQLADSVISVVDVGNHRSASVALRNGMVADKEMVMDGEQVIIYRASFT